MSFSQLMVSWAAEVKETQTGMEHEEQCRHTRVQEGWSFWAMVQQTSGFPSVKFSSETSSIASLPLSPIPVILSVRGNLCPSLLGESFWEWTVSLSKASSSCCPRLLAEVSSSLPVGTVSSWTFWETVVEEKVLLICPTGHLWSSWEMDLPSKRESLISHKAVLKAFQSRFSPLNYNRIQGQICHWALIATCSALQYQSMELLHTCVHVTLAFLPCFHSCVHWCIHTSLNYLFKRHHLTIARTSIFQGK